MAELKQVKVDNWGIYFLQRLKHFFNRTDYCDLTLQFQDNAQLKVHRLVLNACTEYFELLERTCEMYEDCLIMPDDLQADVVVPIVNFMYTGQLEFKAELLEKLLQTSQIMNMPVLSKLLEAQRHQSDRVHSDKNKHSYARASKRSYPKSSISENKTMKPPQKKVCATLKPSHSQSESVARTQSSSHSRANTTTSTTVFLPRVTKQPTRQEVNPCPTRYDVPEELDNDSIYDDSFHNISYESKPLMVHPETSKRYESKKPNYGIFSDASSSRKFITESSTLDMVECRKITPNNDSLFDDPLDEDPFAYQSNDRTTQSTSTKEQSRIFDQVIDQNNTGPKVTIEAKNSKQAAKVDHAKIISEVLKKYPHLVNSNKNIKLKILDTPSKPDRKSKKSKPAPIYQERAVKVKEEPDAECTYVDVLNSKEAARLISLGAENVNGPWICLICGTPGKALNFPKYYQFRRHLVEVHKEKPIPTICEYCGLKSGKRNYLLHHMYTKHGVPPPANYHFPKCSQCNYIALTEGFLIKHKASHYEQRDFRCYVCFSTFKNSNLLLQHIQNTGHKYSAERKANLQCIYCQKVFLRENNLYAHLKTNHKAEVKRDGIVDDSEEEEEREQIHKPLVLPIKFEPVQNHEDNEEENQVHEYEIQADGNIQPSTKKTPPTPKQKILNAGIDTINTKTGNNMKNFTFNRNDQEDLSANEMRVIEPNREVHDQIIISTQEYEEPEEYYIEDMEQPATSQNIRSSELTSLQHAAAVEESNTQPIEIMMSDQQQLVNASHQIVTPGHPVLFDEDGNPSKALAVLTTLDGAHANDMMIIKNEYPMNVSTVDTKNSNIVVVYSSNLSNQGKPSFIVNPQYAHAQINQSQIVTGQDIGHFVTSSAAVITPTYATIDTSAPVVTTQSLQTYDNYVEHVEDHHPPETSVVQEATNDVSNVITTSAGNSNKNNFVEITEMRIVHSSNMQGGELEVATNEGDHDTQSSNANEDPLVLNSAPTVTEEVMEVDAGTINNGTEIMEVTEVVQQIDTVDEINETTNDDQQLEEELPSIDIRHGQENIDNLPLERSENIVENVSAGPEEIASTENEVSLPESPTFTQNYIENSQDNVQSDTEITQNEVSVNETVGDLEAPVKNKEQIQNLASEWSEDEEVLTNSNEVAVIANKEIADSADVEESIENIQQEMDNQMANLPSKTVLEKESHLQETMEEGLIQGQVDECNTPGPDEPVEEIITEDVPVTILQEPENIQEQTNGVSAEQPEKISSLLNDWDENDSQDEPTADNLPEHSGTDVTENDEKTEKSNVQDVDKTKESGEVKEPSENKEVPNIRSLVSDWDEDDDI
ncbi:hypothetical protein JYU34_015798 [Plutella xylostella]|uniref:Centrosome-associated zinc finger protein CP190 n=1 Tax=Plutella xylostella TaxID=51655 RepID=A0ABQ7Q4R3_PLUXY|nr:hypothetical protein JYU34_015798 [Plutella xylostella]